MLKSLQNKGAEKKKQKECATKLSKSRMVMMLLALMWITMRHTMEMKVCTAVTDGKNLAWDTELDLSGFKYLFGSLCCVLGQDTVILEYSSTLWSIESAGKKHGQLCKMLRVGNLWWPSIPSTKLVNFHVRMSYKNWSKGLACWASLSKKT